MTVQLEAWVAIMEIVRPFWEIGYYGVVSQESYPVLVAGWPMIASSLGWGYWCHIHHHCFAAAVDQHEGRM